MKIFIPFLVLLGAILSSTLALAQSPVALPQVVVTPTGREQSASETSPSVAVLERDAIAHLGAIHPSELRLGVPGLWISRGNGQEHLLALRSPVLTGAGACGAFLFLENHIPVRPAGLCNVNQIIEMNLEQADAVEVLRGPGPARFGSNALHGIIHSRTFARTGSEFTLTAGPDDFVRAQVAAGVQRGVHTLRGRFVGAHDGGLRADSGYGLSKLNLDASTQHGEIHIDAHLAATLLNQETASFIVGLDAFADPAIARANDRPQAYRDAQAQRLSFDIRTPNAGTFRPFFRRSRMEFLQHFLPGQPTENNGQTSAGVQWQRALDGAFGLWDVGADIEWADIDLRQDQAAPVTIPSAFLRATRPPGPQYDFSVRALNVAAFVERIVDLSPRSALRLGARVEHTDYDYRTALPAGNNDAQGNACGFGGCLYTRPDNRTDQFTNLAPKLQWSYLLTDTQRAFVALKRGFRAPQVTELYRLQSGQSVADLDAETLDSLELGWRTDGAARRLSVVAYGAVKRDQILRDTDGFNVSGGKTLHYGLELDGAVALGRYFSLAGSASLARHRYRFERNVAGSEPIRRGDDVDTAPRSLANAALTFRPNPRSQATLEWEHMGGYFLDAANAHRYGGHNLLHGVVETQVGNLTLGIKIRNLMDRAFAERADFAFGNYRYFPGQPRSVFVTARYQPGGG